MPMVERFGESLGQQMRASRVTPSPKSETVHGKALKASWLGKPTRVLEGRTLHLQLTQLALPFLDVAAVDELVRRGSGRSDKAHNLLLVVERAHAIVHSLIYRIFCHRYLILFTL